MVKILNWLDLGHSGYKSWITDWRYDYYLFQNPEARGIIKI